MKEILKRHLGSFDLGLEAMLGQERVAVFASGERGGKRQITFYKGN